MNKKNNFSSEVSNPLDKTKFTEFQNLIEAMPVMIYAAEPFAPYSPLYISPAFEMFGYPLEEWRESLDLWIRTIHPDDRKEILQKTQTAIESGGETDFEYRIVARDGGVHWVRDRGCFVRGERGELLYWQGIILDITDRKKGEESLRDSEKRYRQMFEKNHAVKLLIDADTGAIIEANPSACEFYGYPLEEFKTKHISELNTLPAAEVEREMKRAITDDCNYFIFKHCTASGAIRDVEVHSSQLFDEDRNLLYSIVYDITERLVAERELAKREELYRTLASHIPKTAVLLFDRDLRYTLAEGLQLKRHGFSKKMFEGKTLWEIFPPEICERWADYFNRALDGEFISLEEKTAEGYFQSYIIPVKNECEEIFAGMVMWQDITEFKQTENALRENEERYRDLFENANDLIYIHDLEGNFTALNRAGELITGYSREEALKMNIAGVVAPDYLEAARQMIHQKISDDLPTTYDLDIIAKQGNRVSLDLSTRLIYHNGQPVGVQGIARNITERKRVKEALVNSERRYHLLSEGIMHQVWTAQPDGKFDYVNERALKYFDLTIEQMIGEGWQTVVHPDDLPDCLIKWTASLETGQDYEAEFRLKRYDEIYRWHQARATAGLDAEGEIISWFGTNTDIDDKKLAEAKLNHFAEHDALTNLPNRAKFMNHLERAAKRAECNPSFCFAVLFLDLDRFKLINDSLGHSIGDKLLIAIAKRLESCIRPGDIIARLGGDEFTVLLSNINEPADAARVARRFLEKLSVPFKLDGYEVFTSASIGIIVSDDIPRRPDDFLRDADTAMYRAKEAGKAGYEIFDRAMHLRNMNLLEMENDLRRAIENKEFEVFYQPIVALETGEIREFEALIRWRHPQHGLVMPNEFISVAEETGLIIPIGEWILREACRQTAGWREMFPESVHLSVSVNLSAKQLMHPNLTSEIGKILSETALHHGCLKLEVTESMVMENSEKALAVISNLKKLGISFSSDDFGTGYSSLSYLHRFPFDRIKIDRSFVSRMESDQNSEAIVRTILLLGQNLHIEVVAEGIETRRQLEALRQLGCKTGQGYLFAKPGNAESAAQILREGLPNIFDASLFNFDETGERQLLELDKIH